MPPRHKRSLIAQRLFWMREGRQPTQPGSMHNGHSRLWTLVLAAIGVLLGVVGWLLAREFAAIDERLDRITAYVLEQHK